jgi:hypothetical protein
MGSVPRFHVPQDRRVDVAQAPDVLTFRLEGLGRVVLGRGGLSRLKELPLVVVVEVPPRVGAAGGVGVEVGLDAAREAIVLVAGVELNKASREFPENSR